MGTENKSEPRAITYLNGEWCEGTPAVVSASTHSFWLGSTVFDGARALAGSLPDLDRHCARVVQSALGLAPYLTGEEIADIARSGVAKFAADAELYICPMYYNEDGHIAPDASSTKFMMRINEAPLPEPKGFSACRISFRRPHPDMAPTNAKASCLYSNVARGVTEAKEKGFDMGVTPDPDYNVAEFSFTNLFLVKDGVVHTPAINDTFLNGITRQRVIQLLKDDGVPLEERTISFDELLEADEMFSTGNASKVMPCILYEDHSMQPGPMFKRARELYFEYCKTC